MLSQSHQLVNCPPDSVVVCNFSVPSRSAQIFCQSLYEECAPPIALTSIQFPTHGLTAAQPRSPTVANMNMNTTAPSFLESLSTMVR